jgi:uncharacterized protein
VAAPAIAVLARGKWSLIKIDPVRSCCPGHHALAKSYLRATAIKKERCMSDHSGPEASWRAALTQGRFMLQKSAGDGAYVFPPRTMAPGSGIDDLTWVEAKGTGSVYSVTVISPKPPLEPYNVVLVDLDEGPRVMSRIDSIAAQDVAIGMRVKSRIAEESDGPILVFDLA